MSYDQMRSELAALGRETIPPFGMLPISVPGTVDSWYELHAKFGKMSMAELLAPTVKYAEEGVPLTELIAMYGRSADKYFKDLPGAAHATWVPGGWVRRRGRFLRIRIWRGRCAGSEKAVGRCLIEERSRMSLMRSCGPKAGIYGRRIWRRIRRPG
ncbi:MAG: gamma-glutamyltransferase [Candidatus Synoicihabitans palmerolidicus]|nr:gamma-glutamyltransferase [Candidatus Synoicihabitans palmerolidicus]